MRRISWLVIALILLVSCTTMRHGESIQRLSPAWWDLAEARLKAHPLPEMELVFHDRARMPTDREFVEYVEKNAPEGAKIRYIEGRDMLGRPLIRLAVIRYEDSDR